MLMPRWTSHAPCTGSMDRKWNRGHATEAVDASTRRAMGLRPLSRELEGRIADVAARQHGVVTRAQLIESGLSASALGRRLQSGRLRALHRGVYLVGPLISPLAPEMAGVLASGPGAVLSHLSAARLLSPDTVAHGSARTGETNGQRIIPNRHHSGRRKPRAPARDSCAPGGSPRRG